jgi:ABC-2 type transport system ATP-binding protein
METAIRLRGVAKHFGAADATVRAVDGVDLDINPGEIVALLGPNGAGKTTTLDMVLGFTTATEGTVEVFGASPGDAIAAGRVAAVLQTGGLLRDLTVGETVELIASTYANPAPVIQVMERAGIAGLADRKVQACSGGEQQRLRFALALLADPDLLVLDEPTTGMDVQARQDFWDAMAAEARAGRTVVFATHYLAEAEDFAQRIVVMADGRVVADGPTDEIRRRASGRTVQARVDPARIDQVADALRALRPADRITVSGDRLTVATPDSDEVARRLLGDLGGRDLEITSASLEEAFVKLTTPSGQRSPRPQPPVTHNRKESAS